MLSELNISDTEVLNALLMQLDTTKAMGSDGVSSIHMFYKYVQQLSTSLLVIYSI